jgi:ligand-binding sensor domain-containing protein
LKLKGKYGDAFLVKACGLALIFIFLFTDSYAQRFSLSHDLRFDNYNSQSGFVTNTVYRLIRSRKGYIWASGNGIYRFDGKQYERFSKLNNTRGVRDNYTPWFTEDAAGRIWVGGVGGICYYSDDKNEFCYLDISEKEKIKYSAGLSLLGDDIWFVCNYGLCKVNTRSLKVTPTSFKTRFECTAMHPVNSNTLLLCDKQGMYYVYHIREGKYETQRLADKWVGMWGIVQHNNHTWLATNDGIWVTGNDTVAPRQIKGTEGMLASCLSFVPALTGDSILWIGTNGKGLALFNLRTNKLQYSYVPDINNPYSIPGHNVNSIYADQQNIVWFATENGISQLNYNNQHFKTRLLPEYIVTRVAQDSSDKNIVWIAGLQQGVLKVDWKGKRALRNYYRFKSCANTFDEGSHIMNMYQISRDTWLLSSYYTVFTWNSKTGEEKIVSDIAARYFINYKKDSLIIVSSDSIYLCRLPSCKIEPLAAAYGLNDGTYDGEKYLWLPTARGLLRHNTVDNSQKIFRVDTAIDNGGANNMLKAVIGPQGRIICGTKSGVGVFDTVTEQFKFYEAFGDINNPVCNDIKLVGSQAIINTNGGLLSLDLNTGASVVIGLRDKNSYSGRPMGTVNDELVLGLVNEYTYFKPAHLLDIPVPTAPLIEKIKVNNRLVYNPQKGQALSLGYAQNEVTFYFTSFEYADAEHIQFRYKIEGLDTGWSYASKLREAAYKRIPPGDYSFVIQAGNAKGVWNSTASTLHFTIVPPYWQTWWFKAMAVLGFIGVVTGIALINIRRIKRREREKTNANKAIAEMELRALRSQMNPHFIFNSLNSIQKYIWDSKQEDAAEYLTKFSRLIRMILDNSMHKSITLEQEMNALSLYLELEHRRCNAKFDYNINVDNSIDASSVLFPPLILQPYVENAIWHGLLNKDGRGTLGITILKEGESFIKCIIEDDGIGRAAAAGMKQSREMGKVSYGILLTAQRLAVPNENGKNGTVEISDLYDGAPIGTRVVITIPVLSFVKL